MYASYQQRMTPPVVKNLIIANCVALLATELLPFGNEIISRFALFNIESPLFHSYQIFTYMFLHGGISHLFFNMFALWMFGRQLEIELGSQRFFIYYMVCGVGAALLQLGVGYAEYAHAIGAVGEYGAIPLLRVPTVGASGAVYGLLLAFGVLHPNNTIMLLFPPIAMKAKWFVVAYGLLELFFGISGYQAGVAHFAHLGGMLWGLALLYWWRKQRKIFF
ncbi:MAG: rhomboid family intramembrane serine protease [Alistipes sp.]|nr:rhomboid family intramembrane serine protease [Alistipes sp.]